MISFRQFLEADLLKQDSEILDNIVPEPEPDFLSEDERIFYAKMAVKDLSEEDLDKLGSILYEYLYDDEDVSNLIFNLDDVEYMLSELEISQGDEIYLEVFDLLYGDKSEDFQNEPVEESHARLLKATKRNRNKNAHFANMLTKGKARAKKQANKKIARLKRQQRRKYARANMTAIKAYNKSYNAAVKSGKHIVKKYY